MNFTVVVSGLVILRRGLLGAGLDRKSCRGASLVIIALLMLRSYIALMKLSAGYLNCTWMIPTTRSKRCPTWGRRSSRGLPAPGGGADLEPHGRATLAGDIHLLGDDVPGFHPRHPASAECLFRKQDNLVEEMHRGFNDLPTASSPVRAT